MAGGTPAIRMAGRMPAVPEKILLLFGAIGNEKSQLAERIFSSIIIF
jgi:hypothetical protein